MSKDGNVTTWALVATTALGAAGWVTSTMRDSRSAGTGLVTAATELADRLVSEVKLVRDDLVKVRAEAAAAAVRAERAEAKVAILGMQVRDCEKHRFEVMTRLDAMTGEGGARGGDAEQ